MRALLVYNPTATRTRPAVVERVARVLRPDLKLDVVGTKRRDHASFLAAGAAHEGYEAVIALGGDGTLNEVVQGLVHTDVRLAVLPGGSTNVWARTLGLPNNPVAAAAAVHDSLFARRDRLVSLGLANGRYFTFCAGFGYDAAVVRMVEDRARMKRMVRQAAFLWCGVLAWVRSVGAAGTISLQTDGLPPVSGLKALVACNSDPYTFLGPLPARLCPDATLDGPLEAFALTSLGLGPLTRLLRRALLGHAPSRLPFVRAWHDLERAVLRAEQPLPLHVDGDYVGETDTVALRSVPRAVRVVC